MLNVRPSGYKSTQLQKVAAPRMKPSVSTIISLGYPDAVRWQHLLASQIRLDNYCSANVTTSAALPQNRVATLIDSHAEFGLNSLIRLPFYQKILYLFIYSASVAGEETLHTYSYVQSHIKDTRWRIKT